jgi:hypothetical protein
MKLATNIKKISNVGFQLILDDSSSVIGVNLLCDKKILLKKRFNVAIKIKNSIEEKELVNQVIIESISKVESKFN